MLPYALVIHEMVLCFCPYNMPGLAELSKTTLCWSKALVLLEMRS